LHDYETIRGVHSFETTEEEPAYFNIVFDVVNGSPHEVIEKIKALLDNFMIKMMGGDHVSVVAEGHRVNLCVNFPPKIGTMLRAILGDVVNTVQSELKVD